MPRVPSPPRGLTAENPFPDDCAEKFAVVRRIGSGGFGAVFEGLHRGLQFPVAIKLLLDEVLQDEEQVQRFNNEARITAALSHPNIIKVHDHGARYGVPWIAYEYAPGRNLRERLDATSGGLPLAEAIGAAIAVADALEAAHAADILHRDIKPDNVLETEGGRYKVADFGIAKWTREGAVKTRTGLILGTPAYVAPELITGESASPASDIYALGVTLFELLTGERPFPDVSPVQLLELHLGSQVPRASLRKEGLPAALDEIVFRAMAKRVSERYCSAGEMRDDLARIRTGTSSGAPDAASAEASPRSAPSTRKVSRPDRPPAPAPSASGAARGKPRLLLALAAAGSLAVLVIAWSLMSRRTVPPPPGLSRAASARADDGRDAIAEAYAQLDRTTASPGSPGPPGPPGRAIEVLQRARQALKDAGPARARCWEWQAGRPGAASLLARALAFNRTTAETAALAELLDLIVQTPVDPTESPLARASRAAANLVRLRMRPAPSEPEMERGTLKLLCVFLETAHCGDPAAIAQAACLLRATRITGKHAPLGLPPADICERLERIALLSALRASELARPDTAGLKSELESWLARTPSPPPRPAPDGDAAPSPELAFPPGFREYLARFGQYDWSYVEGVTRSANMAHLFDDPARTWQIVPHLEYLLGKTDQPGAEIQPALLKAITAWLAGLAGPAATRSGYWWARALICLRASEAPAGRRLAAIDWLLKCVELSMLSPASDPSSIEVQLRGCWTLVAAERFAREWNVPANLDPRFIREESDVSEARYINEDPGRAAHRAVAAMVVLLARLAFSDFKPSAHRAQGTDFVARCAAEEFRLTARLATRGLIEPAYVLRVKEEAAALAADPSVDSPVRNSAGAARIELQEILSRPRQP